MVEGGLSEVRLRVDAYKWSEVRKAPPGQSTEDAGEEEEDSKETYAPVTQQVIN